MDNQIYRVRLSDNHTLEFYVCDTNDLNPFRDTKEMGVVVLAQDVQIDGSLDNAELDSLINYLQDCKYHIQKFNANSKPTERVFSENDLAKLQSEVHRLTGDGEVMQLFNSLLGVNAG